MIIINIIIELFFLNEDLAVNNIYIATRFIGDDVNNIVGKILFSIFINSYIFDSNNGS